MAVQEVFNNAYDQVGNIARATHQFIETRTGIHKIAELASVALSNINRQSQSSVWNAKLFSNVTNVSNSLYLFEQLAYLTPARKADQPSIGKDWEAGNYRNIAVQIMMLVVVDVSSCTLLLADAGVETMARLAARYGAGTCLSVGVSIFMMNAIYNDVQKMREDGVSTKKVIAVAGCVGEIFVHTVLLSGVAVGGGFYAAAAVSAGSMFVNEWINQYSKV